MSHKQDAIAHLQKLLDAPETPETDRLAARVALLTLTGDLTAAQQGLEALMIPATQWAQAKAGNLEY